MATTRAVSLILLVFIIGCHTQYAEARNISEVGGKILPAVQRQPERAQQTTTAAITWYTGGEARLKLAPVPADQASSIVLAGTTTDKTLVVKVAKKGGPEHSNTIPLTADGSFNVRYLMKDGAGTYTVTFYGSSQKNSLNYRGLGFFTLTVNKPLPANLLHLELNGEVLSFVDTVMGTTVGRGECWDLAQQALDENLADWTRPTSFGRQLNPETDEIKAGDIIQFRSVKTTEHLPGGGTRWETLGAPDHTAVIYRVLGKKRYTLAHQNIGGKRTVMTSDVNLANATGGKYRIYRPVAQMIRNEAKKNVP